MSETKAGQQLTGPASPNLSADSYAGTAEAYARYRVPYPAELLADLRHRASVTGQGRLLDLACGPGRLALPLAPYFSEVWAVDQEPEMVKVGSARAQGQGLSNIRWMVGRAEEVDASPESLELIAIGEAFHRLDQRLIAERAMEWLAPGCGLATLGCFSLMQGREPWHDVLRAVVRRWRSDGSTVTTSAPLPSRPRGSDHDRKVLSMFGFEDLGTYDFPHPYVWTLDSILGNLRSTSRLSRRTLGREAEHFESDLRRELLVHDSSGRYPETLRFGYSLLRKPGDCGEAQLGISQPVRRLP
ncbi:MAG: class I SAM-dependent methyltransferase [Chloroflexi bacterium]|nr:class I SAM-dependent methyltransferase [Chloroflexota bacterium]